MAIYGDGQAETNLSRSPNDTACEQEATGNDVLLQLLVLKTFEQSLFTSTVACEAVSLPLLPLPRYEALRPVLFKMRFCPSLK